MITRPVRDPEVILKTMGSETHLYDPGQGAIHILNPTARLIWDLCDGEHTPPDIAQAVRSHFHVADSHDVLADVERTLETFTAKGLLKHLPGG